MWVEAVLREQVVRGWVDTERPLYEDSGTGGNVAQSNVAEAEAGDRDIGECTYVFPK